MSAGMLPEVMDPDGPIFSISVAASLAEMHPQTLRQYDRLGLVIASRTKGGGRRYSPRDIQRLRLIQRLSQEGINLTGIRRILALQSELVRRLVEQHESQGRRIFSAGSTGNVAQGRFYHPPLALPGR